MTSLLRKHHLKFKQASLKLAFLAQGLESRDNRQALSAHKETISPSYLSGEGPNNIRTLRETQEGTERETIMCVCVNWVIDDN